MTSPFGAPEPSVQLPPAPTRPARSGPLHQVELVVELVGEVPVPAHQVVQLLDKPWSDAMGHPRIWVMTPGADEWRALAADGTWLYDSIALTWPFVTAEGFLNGRSAFNLVRIAEQFAQTLRRRAVPMPPPGQVDSAVHSVREAVDLLDVGFSLGVVFATSQKEELIWRVCVALGLSLHVSGAFVWVQDDGPPQLSVFPLEEPTRFLLSGVKQERLHEGVTIGFSMPLVVSPAQSLAAAYRVSSEFASRFQGLVIDQDNEPLTDAIKATQQRDLHTALQAFSRAGLTPGSSEAMRLFGG